MSDFVETIKKKADELIDSAGNITRTTIKKTSDSVAILKLKRSAKDTEVKIDSLYAAIGRLIYEEYRNGAEFIGEYQEKCVQIENALEELDNIKTQIAELNNQSVCPNCGKYNNSDSAYCSYCGKSMAGF